MSVRDVLNTASPNQLADALRDISFGELISTIIAGMTATETGVSPSSHVATLAAQPTAIFQVNATAGTSTGIKKLLRGPHSGEDAITPAAGECVWNGGLLVKFNAADNVSAASFTYAKTTVTDSITKRDLGQTGNV